MIPFCIDCAQHKTANTVCQEYSSLFFWYKVMIVFLNIIAIQHKSFSFSN